MYVSFAAHHLSSAWMWTHHAGVSYGNLHGQRSVVVPGSSHFPSQSSPFSMHHPINLQASSMGPHRHHAPSSPDHHQSLHELNIISKRSNGSGSPPDSIGSSQQQPVHPIFAVSPSSGITYSWISPPKSLPRKRTVFSRTQRTSLESKFQSQKYISKSERIRFARELGLKDSQVRNFKSC